MTKDRDQEAFTRGFLNSLRGKKPLHEWREAFIVPGDLTKKQGIVIAAIGRGACWFGEPAPFDQPTAVAICRELQETIDAARNLMGQDTSNRNC